MKGVSTERSRFAPALPAGAFGVAIAAEPSPDGAARPVIAGSYRVARADVEALGAPLLARLGLVAQQLHGGDAGGVTHIGAALANPFSDMVLFEDDAMTTPGSTEGAFRVELGEVFEGGLEPGVWIVFAVLGAHSSPPIHVEV